MHRAAERGRSAERSPCDASFPREPWRRPARPHCRQAVSRPWRPVAYRPRYSTGRCIRSEEHTSELQSQSNLVCRLLLEKKKTKINLNISKTILISFISFHTEHHHVICLSYAIS